MPTLRHTATVLSQGRKRVAFHQSDLLVVVREYASAAVHSQNGYEIIFEATIKIAMNSQRFAARGVLSAAIEVAAVGDPAGAVWGGEVRDATPPPHAITVAPAVPAAPRD